MLKIVFLAAGGMIGTFARYFLSGFVHRFTGADFPYGTLAVNLLGCFLIGMFSTLSNEKLMFGPDTKVLLMAGFCGAFTTFSTFMFETDSLIRDSEWLRALGNICLSILIGFILFRVGAAIGKLM